MPLTVKILAVISSELILLTKCKTITVFRPVKLGLKDLYNRSFKPSRVLELRKFATHSC